MSHYDDFNPFLDRFRDRFSGWRRRIERVLGQWRLWDHIDAVLSLAMTQLVDRILEARQARHPAARDEPLPVESLDAPQVRDVLLLAASTTNRRPNPAQRWRRLRKRLRFSTWPTKLDLALGLAGAVAVLALVGWFRPRYLLGPWPYLLIAAGWLPRAWRTTKSAWQAWRITRNLRVLNHKLAPAPAKADQLLVRPARRPAPAPLAADRRPLRVALEAPGGAPLAPLRGDHCPGRSGR